MHSDLGIYRDIQKGGSPAAAASPPDQRSCGDFRQQVKDGQLGHGWTCKYRYKPEAKSNIAPFIFPAKISNSQIQTLTGVFIVKYAAELIHTNLVTLGRWRATESFHFN